MIVYCYSLARNNRSDVAVSRFAVCRVYNLPGAGTGIRVRVDFNRQSVLDIAKAVNAYGRSRRGSYRFAAARVVLQYESDTVALRIRLTIRVARVDRRVELK
jgi:hypothetical protein